MGRKLTYGVVYFIIQIQFFREVWGEKISAREDIYVLPGSDVNLTCQTKEKDFFIQMQWSRVTDTNDLIAVYHAQYGFSCTQGHACHSLATSIETLKNMTKWTLSLRNISSTLSGKYECGITLFPDGIQIMVYNLIVEPNSHDEHNRTIEIETNQTLEIPCFQNTSSEISPGFTFSWLVEKDGAQEVLFTNDHHINHSTSFKGRVWLGTDYGLHLSPVQVQDDGRTFSCHLTVSPLKVRKTSTTVKVFAKAESPVIMETTTMDVLDERIFTCLLKNVFPKANITWLIDGRFLQGDEEGVYITNEEKSGTSGFRELRSVLTRMHGSRPAQSNNMTIQCMAQSPGPRNKMWTTSSQAITFSLDFVTATTEHVASVTGSTLGTQAFANDKVSPTRYPATSSVTIADGNVSTTNTTPQTSDSSTTIKGFTSSRTSSGTDAKNSVSWTPSEMHTSAALNASLAPHDVITGTTKASPDVPTTERRTSRINHNPITNITVSKPQDGMSWPVIVMALLFFCALLFGLGVRKWCQYQKEIMERPPPFKPPPPPIKYTCIQEPAGRDLPCHQMEAL